MHSFGDAGGVRNISAMRRAFSRTQGDFFSPSRVPEKAEKWVRWAVAAGSPRQKGSDVCEDNTACRGSSRFVAGLKLFPWTFRELL
jgi:hypothetical protein